MQISLCPLYLQVILAFCWVYIRKYQSRQESEVISTITAICALAIALITSALLPVDIFLVSFMKYPNGTYKVTIFLYRKVVHCSNSDLCLIQPWSCSWSIVLFFIVHKQSNHKRLRALHDKLFGCLAWMLLLLVYSHHLWKQWHFIPKTSYYSMKCNMTRGQYFRFEFTDWIEHICLLHWDSNGLMRQWLLWQLNGIVNETTGPPFFPTDNE